MSTFMANKKDYLDKKWHVIDAKGETLGRLATRIARILMGKNKTDYTPHVETGDGVIVLNAGQVVVTGNKGRGKIYTRFTGYPSGIIRRTFDEVMQRDPLYALKHAVKGMLPKNTLGKRMITRLLLYTGSEHPHAAQISNGKPKASKEKAKATTTK